MDHGAMDDALEARGRRCFAVLTENEIRQLFVDKIGQLGPEPVHVNVTRTQNRGRVAVVKERQQQMFERGVFVMALVGIFDGAMQ